MNNNSIPLFFKWRILLSSGLGIGILGITLALGVWIGQWSHLPLSTLLCVALFARAWYLYYLAYTQRYWSLEATCTALRKSKLHRYQQAVFTSDNGTFTYLCTKDRELYPNEQYIFYLRKHSGDKQSSNIILAGDIIDFSVKL